MRLSIYSALFCIIISFYFFAYVDGMVLLVCSALWIMLIATGTKSTTLSNKAHKSSVDTIKSALVGTKESTLLAKHNSANKRKIYIQCVAFACFGALFAYNAAFRYSIHNYASSLNTDAHLVVSTLTSSLLAQFPAIATFLQTIEVGRVAKLSFDSLKDYVHNDTASMIIALITAQKEFMHGAFSDMFRRNGISHLLALSGFHLSLIIIGIQTVLNAAKKLFSLELHRFWMEATIIVLVWIYCLWIGFIPSLYRAALMYTLATIARYYFGINNFLLVWTITGMLLFFIKPDIMYSHGFVLSMLALLGVYGGLHYSAYLCRVLPSVLAVPLAVGLGATLCTSWYSVVAFGASYPIGIITSLLLTPLVTLFMVAGIGFLLLVYLINFVPLLEVVAIYVGKLLDLVIDGVRLLLAHLSSGISIDSYYKLAIYYLLLISAILLYRKIIFKQDANGNTRDIQRNSS